MAVDLEIVAAPVRNDSFAEYVNLADAPRVESRLGEQSGKYVGVADLNIADASA